MLGDFTPKNTFAPFWTPLEPFGLIWTLFYPFGPLGPALGPLQTPQDSFAPHLATFWTSLDPFRPPLDYLWTSFVLSLDYFSTPYQLPYSLFNPFRPFVTPIWNHLEPIGPHTTPYGPPSEPFTYMQTPFIIVDQSDPITDGANQKSVSPFYAKKQSRPPSYDEHRENRVVLTPFLLTQQNLRKSALYFIVVKWFEAIWSTPLTKQLLVKNPSERENIQSYFVGTQCAKTRILHLIQK